MSRGNVETVLSALEGRRCLDLGGDKVLALYRTFGVVFTLRDGNVAHTEAYPDAQEALKAAFEHSFRLFGTEDLDGAVSGMSDDVEWEHQTGTGAPEEGLYRGRDQVRSLLGRLREAWEDFRVDVRGVVDQGNVFVVNGVIHARGRFGIELEGDCEYVIEFRDAKAVRLRFSTSGTPSLSSQEASDAA